MKYQASLILFVALLFTARAQHQSLNFDGVDDAVSLGDVLNFGIQDSFAIQVWVKPDPGQAYQQIISKSGTNYRGWGLQLSYGKPEMFFVESFGQNQIVSTADVVIDDGQWHSITVNHYGNGIVLIEVDTAFQSMVISSMGAPDSIATSASALIGASDLNNQPSEFFKGHIDELRIWNTVLGTNNTYSPFIELTGNEPDLIGYYKFDHSNSACDVVDYSPSGNHGQRQGAIGLNNMPQYVTVVPTLIPQSSPAVPACGLLVLPEAKVGELKLFPNPSNGKVNVELEYSENTVLSVSNMHGAVVLQREFFGSQYYFDCDLPAGQYLITVSQESAVYRSKIFIN